jgi:hypothetical protein
MPMAPYPGQGDPLSASAGYTGEWIVGGEFCAKGSEAIPYS